MRAQLIVAGLAISALGVFFFLLQPFLGLSIPLAINPTSGPPGTSVNITATGLPEASRVYLYWYEMTQNNGTYYFVTSGEVGTDGRFVGPVNFEIPKASAGIHNVTATSSPLGPTTSQISTSEIVGVVLFNITSSTTPSTPISSASEPSPLEGWGVVTILAGLALTGIGFFAKERNGPVEPPPGQKFCVFCSVMMPQEAPRCPQCNGLQPKEET